MNQELVSIPKSDISKAEISAIATGLILRIEEGEVNPVAAHVRLKAIIKALEQVLRSTEQIVWDEAELNGRTFSAFGADIQLKEGAMTPDYTHDQVWSDLQASMKAREEQLKMAYFYPMALVTPYRVITRSVLRKPSLAKTSQPLVFV